MTLVNPYDPAPGSTIGPWLILERVDSGSYGLVFRVQRAGHPEAGSFALKLARHAEDPRFEREAELLQRVRHSAVPRFMDSGFWTSPEGHRHPYLVMEWVEGFTLYDWMRKAPRTNREALRVLAQVAQGLEAVHAVGAVHRDVKGDNIRVTPEGRAVLLDFGSGWLPDQRILTDTAAPPGTTRYRAPELLRFMWRVRMDTDARWETRPSDDLYSLGVTAYRLVTGTYLPPIDETRDDAPRKVLRPTELATVAPELEALILRLLSEGRTARDTTSETAQAMERAAQGAGPELDRPLLPTAAAVPTEKGAPDLSSRSSSPSRSSRSSRPQPSTKPRRRAARMGIPLWLSWASAAMVGGVLVVLATNPRQGTRTTEIPPPITQEVLIPSVEAPDAGVGDMALASAQGIPRVGLPAHVVGLPMPKAPLPGQKRPPCDRSAEVLVLGACWVVIAKTPPCDESGFEYDGKCILPNVPLPPQPTSEQP